MTLLKYVSAALGVCVALTAPATAQNPYTVKSGDRFWVASCHRNLIDQTYNTLGEFFDPSLSDRHYCGRIAEKLAARPGEVSNLARRAEEMARRVVDAVPRVIDYVDGQSLLRPRMQEGGFVRVHIRPNRLSPIGPTDNSAGYYESGRIGVQIDPRGVLQQYFDQTEFVRVMAHEIFHDIQQTYLRQGEEDYLEFDFLGDWFWEATPQYFASVVKELNVSRPTKDWLRSELEAETRHFSAPFTSTAGRMAYDVWPFYALLSRHVAAGGAAPAMSGATRIGAADLPAGYLGQILTSMRGMKSYDPASMLAAFDAALKRWHADGFYRFFPAVMADFSHPRFMDRSGHKLFDSAPVEMSVSTDRRWHETRHIDVDKLAIRVAKLDLPPGRPGLLSISFDLTPQQEHEFASDLHLAVNGQYYSYDHGNEPRNSATIKIDGSDETVFVTVANIAQDPAKTDKRDGVPLRVAWLDGGECEYNAMVEQTNEAGLRFLGEELYGNDEFFIRDFALTEAEYLNRHGNLGLGGLTEPDTHPGLANIAVVAPGFSLSSPACVHHMATSPTLEASGALAGFAGELGGPAQSTASLLETLLEQVAPGQSKGIMKSLGLIRDLSGDDPRQASLVFSVFTPGLQTFWAGALTAPYVAGGKDGGQSAALNIVLPGITVTDLEEGRSYPAILSGPAGGNEVRIADRWDGNGVRRIGVNDGQPVNGFEGMMQSLTIDSMTGFVEVTDITSAWIEGKFTFSGTGVVETETIDWVLSDAGYWMEDADLTSLTGGVKVTGTFKAPAGQTGPAIPRHVLVLKAAGVAAKPRP